MKISVREVAALAIHEVLTQEHSLSKVMPYYLDKLNAKDRGLCQELCYGVCRHLHQMQYWVKHLLKNPLKTKDHDILALIYLGIYQLLFTRIPDHAAIGETVEVAQKFNKPWAKTLLNGILRNVQRQQGQPQPAWLTDSTYCYSHPKWFIKAMQLAWPEHWQGILDANNLRPPMTLRVNTLQQSRDAYLQQLATAELPARAADFSPSGIQLEQPVDVSALPNFAAGAVSVQDEAAQFAAALLDLRPGLRVLDACCAPGGKTCHILETQPNLHGLLALDHDPQRLVRVTENLQRLQLTAMLKTGDAGNPQQWWDGQAFDRILLDAPCSATGVIRRHPDIKLLRRSGDIANLARLQLSLLAALWPTLSSGGKLVYATCSVLPEENEMVIAQFLAMTDDAQHHPIIAPWGVARPQGRQLFPQPNGHDGFYYACLHKA